jgi:hypothetical protein
MATQVESLKIVFDDSLYPGVPAVVELRLGKTTTKLFNPYYIPTLEAGDPDPLNAEVEVQASDIRLVPYTLRPDITFELDLGTNILAFKVPTTTKPLATGGTVTDEDVPVEIIGMLQTLFDLT